MAALVVCGSALAFTAGGLSTPMHATRALAPVAALPLVPLVAAGGLAAAFSIKRFQDNREVRK